MILQKTLVLFLLLLTFSAFAEEVYINDKLRVGVRPEPNNSEAPITVVVTGDKLDVLDNVSGYLKVRTDKGVEGWIKEIYTTRKKPAIIRLTELTESSGGDNARLIVLEQQVATLQEANQGLAGEIETLREDKTKLEEELANSQVVVVSENNKVYWIAGLIIVALIGFFFGKYRHQQQVMKRFGGLKI